jgi:lysozyme
MNRKLIVGLTVSTALLLSISSHEGFSEKAYIPIPRDVPTIGFGTTVHPSGVPVKLGETITRQKASEYLQHDLDKFKTGMARCVTAPLYQNEFDAFLSLTYNIGTGAFCSSSIPRKLNAGDYKAACETILQFNKMKDTSKPMVRDTSGKLVYQYKVLKGLDNRRKSEYKECTGGGV